MILIVLINIISFVFDFIQKVCKKKDGKNYHLDYLYSLMI